MKASVYSLEGKAVREITLPKAFEEPLNRELIKRAVLSMQSKRKQPSGSNPRAGRDNTAVARSNRKLPAAERTINVDRARLPRLKSRRHLLYGRVARVPHAVGGTAAHPPKSEKRLAEEINRKERRKALRSAIAASANRELVAARHVLPPNIKLPLVVESRFEGLDKTRDAVKFFKAINVLADLENAKKKGKKRAGKGKKRGRKKKQKKSLLVVITEKGKAYGASRNLPGVDVSNAGSLNVELLAPGGQPGRLVVWTEQAIKAVGEKK